MSLEDLQYTAAENTSALEDLQYTTDDNASALSDLQDTANDLAETYARSLATLNATDSAAAEQRTIPSRWPT